MFTHPTFQITPIPALKDNYIWVIHRGQHAVVIDPGETAPVLEFLDNRSLLLDAILCTHRHNDHIGGIAKLRELYNVPVYGRRHSGNPHITHDLREGEQLKLDTLGIQFDILEIPGHLDDHIAYLTPEIFAPGILFCGDVLFGAGCGRNNEGGPAKLHHSLQRLARLPDTTRVYCAHEYTAANLRFALACEANNIEVQERIIATQALRAKNLPTLPSTIALEKATNPFLRCTQPEIIRTLQQRGLIGASEAKISTSGISGAGISELAVFTALREWKNHF